MRFIRPIVILFGLVLMWQAIVFVTGVPAYILPGPISVFEAALSHTGALFKHTMTTLLEIIAGLLIGTLLGL
jgi:ABC-type nitrate/sulfonate/bicarbonate transport system permease component